MHTEMQQSDIEALLDSLKSGKPLDPEIAKRIKDRAEEVREETRKKYGVQNIGVGLIREHRDARPRPVCPAGTKVD